MNCSLDTVKKLYLNNLFLLGFSIKGYRHILFSGDIEEDTFDVPNMKAMECVLHFLFKSVDEERCEIVFRNIFPTFSSQSSNTFREKSFGWIRIIEKTYKQDLGITMHLLSRGCGKRFNMFLWKFSALALRLRYQREFPESYRRDFKTISENLTVVKNRPKGGSELKKRYHHLCRNSFSYQKTQIRLLSLKIRKNCEDLTGFSKRMIDLEEAMTNFGQELMEEVQECEKESRRMGFVKKKLKREGAESRDNEEGLKRIFSFWESLGSIMEETEYSRKLLEVYASDRYVKNDFTVDGVDLVLSEVSHLDDKGRFEETKRKKKEGSSKVEMRQILNFSAYLSSFNERLLGFKRMKEMIHEKYKATQAIFGGADTSAASSTTMSSTLSSTFGGSSTFYSSAMKTQQLSPFFGSLTTTTTTTAPNNLTSSVHDLDDGWPSSSSRKLEVLEDREMIRVYLIRFLKENKRFLLKLRSFPGQLDKVIVKIEKKIVQYQSLLNKNQEEIQNKSLIEEEDEDEIMM